MNRATTQYLPTLDGWRAIAILGVLACHALAAPFGEGPYASPFWLHVAQEGATGVPIFFGLSGFLITTRLLDELTASGGVSLRQFYLRRAFRILPPYVSYLLALLLLAAVGALTVTWQEVASCFLFFRNYLRPASLGGWYTGHFWSLAIEEHFYMLCPGLLVLLGPKRMRGVALGVALAVGLWRWQETRHPGWPAIFEGIEFSLRTDIRIDGLFAGAFTALLAHDPAWRARLARWLNRPVWLGLLVFAFACMKSWVPLPGLGFALSLPLLILGTVLHSSGPVGRALEWGPVAWVGRISYGLYVWQQLFLVRPSELPSLALGPLQRFPLNVAATFAVAIASYHLMEKPLMAWGRRRFPGNVAPREQQPAVAG